MNDDSSPTAKGFKLDIDCHCGVTHEVLLVPGIEHRLKCGTVLRPLPTMEPDAVARDEYQSTIGEFFDGSRFHSAIFGAVIVAVVALVLMLSNHAIDIIKALR